MHAFHHFNMEEKLEDDHHVNDAEQRIHLSWTTTFELYANFIEGKADH
jgi:hypothetical protein